MPLCKVRLRSDGEVIDDRQDPCALRIIVLRPVLAGGFAKLTGLGGYDFEADPAQVGEWASHVVRAWGTGAVLEAPAPAMEDNARYRD
jgi:hypothetical protein